MVTEKIGVLPVNVQSFHGPAIGAGRGANAGSLCFGAVFAETGPIGGDGKQGIPARPRVGVGAELIG